MVTALSSPQNLITDTWVSATWEEFVAMCNQLDALIERPELAKAQRYYDYGWMRIETMSTGSGHGQDNTLLSQVVSLFGIIRNIRLKGFTNTSFRYCWFKRMSARSGVLCRRSHSLFISTQNHGVDQRRNLWRTDTSD